MKYIKAFIAGIALPAIVFPFIVFASQFYNVLANNIAKLFWIPWLWGFWNIGYLVFRKYTKRLSENANLALCGIILGLAVAGYVTFAIKLPAQVGVTGLVIYAPLIVIPTIYAILWRFFVKYFNRLLAV